MLCSTPAVPLSMQYFIATTDLHIPACSTYLCNPVQHLGDTTATVLLTVLQGRVLRSLWVVHWRQLATAAGCRMLQNLTAWAGPFLLQALLGHLQAQAAFCKSQSVSPTAQYSPQTPCLLYWLLWAICTLQCMLYIQAVRL